jgi:hypothetical protein
VTTVGKSKSSPADKRRRQRPRNEVAAPPVFESFSKAIEYQMMAWLLGLDRPEMDTLELAEGLELIEDCKQTFQTGRDTLLVRAILAERYDRLLSAEPSKTEPEVFACRAESTARKAAMLLSSAFPQAKAQIDAAMRL